MNTNSTSPAQFTLREILFAVVLTFLGMAVLNFVSFANNPVIGCGFSIVSMLLCFAVVVQISEPDSANRFIAMPIAYLVMTLILLFLVIVVPRGGEAILAA